MRQIRAMDRGRTGMAAADEGRFPISNTTITMGSSLDQFVDEGPGVQRWATSGMSSNCSNQLS
jgi:hypothetical protein